MTLRVGFLGAGFIANLHAYQLRACATPNRIVAVFDPDPDRARTFGDLSGATPRASAAEVVEAVDVVFVCNWSSEHPAAVELAAGAGRALFVEKPLAVDLPHATRLAEIVADSGVPNAVGLVLRSSPALLALRELVSHPAAGRPMNIVFRDDQYLPVQGVYGSDWRIDRERAGSGVLLEHSIHDLDILEWLAGPIESLAAVAGNFHGHAGIEDSVALLARFHNGASATLTTLWHDMLSRPSDRSIEVFCQNSHVALSGDFVGPLHWSRQASGSDEVQRGELDGDTILDWLAAADVEVVSAEERFLRAVANGGGDAGPTVADALRAHVLVDAAYRSAALDGAPVAVPAPDRN